jgi:hypothetical protein
VETEVVVSGDGGGGKWRRRQKYAETENASKYYFLLTTSTIYPMLVLIVKGMRHARGTQLKRPRHRVGGEGGIRDAY